MRGSKSSKKGLKVGIYKIVFEVRGFEWMWFPGNEFFELDLSFHPEFSLRAQM
jgi:hypothetical protein